MLVARGPMDDGGGMLAVVGRWMSVGGRDGWKMEADDGGQTGHPGEFSNPKRNKFDIFLDVDRNC